MMKILSKNLYVSSEPAAPQFVNITASINSIAVYGMASDGFFDSIRLLLRSSDNKIQEDMVSLSQKKT